MISEMEKVAKKLQQDRLHNFGGIALAFAGAKFKVDEFDASAKRFERNIIGSDSQTICATTTYADKTLTFTNEKDRWCIVSGLVIELYADTIIEAPVAGQIYRSMAVELKRACGTSFQNALRGFVTGFDNVQAEADVPLPNAGQVKLIKEMLIDGNLDNITPLDVWNPGEGMTLKLNGLNAITAAASHNGAIHARAYALTYDAIKG
jgi:hypothetical protein